MSGGGKKDVITGRVCFKDGGGEKGNERSELERREGFSFYFWGFVSEEGC